MSRSNLHKVPPRFHCIGLLLISHPQNRNVYLFSRYRYIWYLKSFPWICFIVGLGELTLQESWSFGLIFIINNPLMLRVVAPAHFPVARHSVQHRATCVWRS